MKRRVVITGMGIWSCIGQDIATVTDNLKKGKSGIGVRQGRKQYGYNSLLTGIVPQPELKSLLDRRKRITLSEEAEYAYMATRQALQDAGIDSEYPRNNEIGVIFGNDSSNQSVLQSYLKAVEEGNTMMLGTGLAFQALTSNVAMTIANIFAFSGLNFTTSSACASSAQAIALASMLIQNGLQDIVVAGGAQETNDFSMIAFDGVGTLSQRNNDPQHASRPFDKQRDGLVPSGGAATLVLEEYEHAEQRGANIYAEIVGYGFSQNRTQLGQPSAEDELLAMHNALQNAGISAQDIDYVNAHATSTIAGDAVEAAALQKIFGNIGYRPYVSSTKSMTGHECWMAGASEMIYTILMMQNSFIAPSINIEDVDESASELNIVQKTIYTDINIALTNSFGFGGTNCSLILRKV